MPAASRSKIISTIFRLGFQRPPVPVHRLDADTSGCLLLARNPKALKRFAARVRGAAGRASAISGVLAGNARSQGRHDRAGAVARSAAPTKGWRMIPARRGKPALTDWRVAGRSRRPRAGRVPPGDRPHPPDCASTAASGIGIPLVGDPVYGDGKGAWRTMLHAAGARRRARRQAADRRHGAAGRPSSRRSASPMPMRSTARARALRSPRKASSPPRARRAERQQGGDRGAAAARRLRAAARAGGVPSPEGARRQPDDRQGRDRRSPRASTAPRR